MLGDMEIQRSQLYELGVLMQKMRSKKMKYYINEKMVFRINSGMLEVFSIDEKEWCTVSFKVSDRDIEDRSLSEIPVKEALQLVGNMLLENLDDTRLKELITFFEGYQKVEWTPARRNEKGVIILGFPNYPDELFEAIEILGFDYDCYENERKLSRRISRMDILQIRTYFTLLSRQERFCDGVLAEAVEDRTILKLLLRLAELKRTV